MGKISKKEESLVSINISQKSREELLKGRFLGRNLFKKNYGRISGGSAIRDSSQKWLRLEVYSPLIWGAKGEIIFRLFPIISISQKFFSIFFLTLEKKGIDEKVICYHNISN